MCLNKLYIKSNKLEFNSVFDKYYNYIPCGVCDECLATKSQDIITRLQYHYDWIRKIGGICFYFTLTYDNRSLPKFKNVPCFNRFHIDRFIDNLRHNFEKDLFSYQMVCEYGHENMRPHYHFLWFVHYPYSVQLFHDKVNKYWQFGNVNWSLNCGVVSSYKPFQYVSKYINKDVNFINKVLQQKFISKEDLSDFCNFRQFLFPHLEIVPFNLRSNGIGSYMAKTLSFNDLVRGYTFRNDDLGISKKTMIPLYIMRKLLKETYKNKNGNVSYRYNSFGLDVLRARILRNISRNADIFKVHFDSLLPSYYNISLLKNKYDYETFKNLLQQFRVNHSFVEFSAYVSFYRGLNFEPSDSLVEDIDFYLSSCSDDIVLSSYKVSLFDELISIYDIYLSNFSFEKYKIRQRAFNTKQLLLSYKTGKYKPVDIKTYNQFINYKNGNLCLSTLLNLPLLERSVHSIAV